MNEKQKEQIREALRLYVMKYPSQNKAAASLDGTSAGTVSSVLSGKWENISDDMWRKIASQVGTATPGAWQMVETTAAKEMAYAMTDAQEWKNVTWVVGEAGCGKTTAARLYEREHSGAYYILCSEDMKRSDFIRDIAKKIGLRTDGMTIRDMLDAIIGALIQTENPVLLFDEADKLTERVFHYFIDLYNRLEDKCGIDSLGFILGDEGSGGYIGKTLLRDYMRGNMPPEVFAEVKPLVGKSVDEIIEQVYQKPKANRYCAQFCKWVGDHRHSHPYYHDLMLGAFRDFFRNIVSLYPDYRKYKFNCVGSVAFHYSDLLGQTAEEFGMKMGDIIKAPIDGLIEFHKPQAR